MYPDGTRDVPGAIRQFTDGTRLRLVDGIREYPDGSKDLPGGARVHPDGIRVLDDGTRVLSDRTRVSATGVVTGPDGRVVTVRGPLVLPDGTRVQRGGVVQSADGSEVRADGTRVLPDGTVVWCDTVTRTLPDGSILYGNGLRVSPTGGQLQAPTQPAPTHPRPRGSSIESFEELPATMLAEDEPESPSPASAAQTPSAEATAGASLQMADVFDNRPDPTPTTSDPSNDLDQATAGVESLDASAVTDVSDSDAGGTLVDSTSVA